MANETSAHTLSTVHAIEGNCSVVLLSSFTQRGVDRMDLGDGKLYHIGGGGCACIIALDGRKLTEDIGEEEEGLLIADLDFNEILRESRLCWMCMDITVARIFSD